MEMFALNQNLTKRITRIIFLVSYARILTYETLSYMNHNVAKNTRSMCTIVTHLNDTELEKKSILKIHLQISLSNRRV